MESSSQANCIHLSSAAFEQMQVEGSALPLVPRGKIDIKGKGK